ncbi:hypothetical protein [Streptomyces virginiae]|uniref:hypothetical protein n=1 Tax=Streptomyces virginiae TaxID=1961 RepID=UPI002E2838BA|nr:hypothetical protein [Streptomyces virginiae]
MRGEGCTSSAKAASGRDEELEGTEYADKIVIKPEDDAVRKWPMVGMGAEVDAGGGDDEIRVTFDDEGVIGAIKGGDGDDTITVVQDGQSNNFRPADAGPAASP